MRHQMKLWPLPALFAASLLLGSCEEHLPAYEMPTFQLQASIVASDEWETPETGGDDWGQFSVEVLNVTGAGGGAEQYVLFVPYEVKAAISVSLVKKPSRSVLVETEVRFAASDDNLGPGETVRVYIDFPSRDSQGYQWNWEEIGVTEFELSLRGTVFVLAPDHVPPVDLELHTPTRIVNLIYSTP